jgi:REP element-mobilizing transposase RayT
MPKTYTNLLTHVVFSTKERLPLIENEIKPRLFAYLGGIVREIGGAALIVGGTNDHVHLLVGLPPTLALSDVVRTLKTNSSRWMHEQSSQKFEWQRGFGAFSVSSANIEGVKNYIANQEEHHKQVSFRDEFIEFLKRSNTPFDEQFLWK